MLYDECAIRVSNLSKCFRVYDNPKDRLKELLFSLINLFNKNFEKSFHRQFWALRDVSFTVKKGGTVGIIGHNGSGKSTLLQIIAGTLAPTSGKVEVSGRVAALLELGSGFNPEFSGRDNVRMYAQILGLSLNEINSKYEDIVKFSELEEFIEQPLKTYSSGMAMRLAFSVVAHVNPDVMIVDEALAVGDTFFQAKCMALINKLLKNGMTLLFVSHDSSSIKALCKDAVMLDSGCLYMVGKSDDVVEAYYAKAVTQRDEIKYEIEDQENPINESNANEYQIDNSTFLELAKFQRLSNGRANFTNVVLLDMSGKSIRMVEFGQLVTLRMVIKVVADFPVLCFGYHVKDKSGIDIAYSDSGVEGSHIYEAKAGSVYTIDWTFKAEFREGTYSVTAVCSFPKNLEVGLVETCDHVPIALQFVMCRGEFPLYGSMRLDASVDVKKLVEL